MQSTMQSTLGMTTDQIERLQLLHDWCHTRHVRLQNSSQDLLDCQMHYSIAEVQVDNSPGSMRQTGNPLDAALMGDGFFSVMTPRGERFTRAGAFTTNSEGQIVTPAGDIVQKVGDENAVADEMGIRIPSTAEEIAIATDGTVQVDGETVGRLRVVSFTDPAVLQKEGVTLYTSPEEPAQDVQPGEITVVQGHLETANFNAVGGMTELISASRSFDIFQKTIDTFRRLDERAARDIASRG